MIVSTYLLGSAFISPLLAQEPQQIDLILPSEVGHKYRKTTFGANCLLLSRPFDYTLPGFIDKYNEAQKPFFRYPGGTPSNFLNFETGLLDVTEEDNASRYQRNTSTNDSIISRHGEGGFPIDTFFDFAELTGAQYSISINMTSMEPADNKRFMEHIQNLGGKPTHIELGNELYFGTYSDYIEDAATYSQESQAQANAIREVFPAAKIGALIPSHIYSHESFLPDPFEPDASRQGQWLETLTNKQDYFDAVVIHMYSSNGMDSNTQPENFLEYEVSYQHALSHTDHEFDSAMEKIKTLFPDKEIWVTEYHVGGFSSNLSSFNLRYAYLGALFTDYFFLKLLETPEVTVSHWHSFIQMITWSGTPDEQTVLGRKVTYDVFKELGTVVKGNSYFSPVLLNNTNSYNGLGEYAGTFPDVYATYLHGTNAGTIVLINKLDTEYVIGNITIDGQSGDHPLNMVSARQIRPLTSQLLHDAVRNEDTMTVETIPAGDPTGIALPPYSITYINLDQNWDILGMATDLDLTKVYLANDDSTFKIQFTAAAGFAYRLWRSNTLEPDNWTVIQEVENLHSVDMELSDPNPQSETRYYRIEQFEL